jgi:hypothetical protein
MHCSRRRHTDGGVPASMDVYPLLETQQLFLPYQNWPEPQEVAVVKGRRTASAVSARNVMIKDCGTREGMGVSELRLWLY